MHQAAPLPAIRIPARTRFTHLGLLFAIVVGCLRLMAIALLQGHWALAATPANDLANYICRGTAPTTLTAPIKMSLHTGDPGTTGANESTGGSYARQSAGYNAASGGACALAASVSFTGMPASTVTHMGLWDSNAAPKFLQGAVLAASKTLGAGDTFTMTAATDTFS